MTFLKILTLDKVRYKQNVWVSSFFVFFKRHIYLVNEGRIDVTQSDMPLNNYVKEKLASAITVATRPSTIRN